ncbi:MAG: glycosyltransferase [Polyangiaceae bacterium]|nr:glycosyltransferase [Polyangiaceae bacterium]
MVEQPIPITVVMRSYNDASLLPQTLGALAAQQGVNVQLVVFESASTDGSVAIFERHVYQRMVRLSPGSYHSALVLNEGVRGASTELVAFVNSDAIMMDRMVLLRLAKALLGQPSLAGVFARQIPRPEASVMTILDYSIAFEHRQELGRFADSLSLVCSMIKKSAWSEVPFDERLTYAEDVVWSQQVRERGWTTRYIPEAVVEHSHEYSPQAMYSRQFGDFAALEILANSPPPRDLWNGVLWPLFRRCVRDIYRLVRLGEFRALWRLPFYRYPMMAGQWRGRLAGRRFLDERPGGRQPKLSLSEAKRLI